MLTSYQTTRCNVKNMVHKIFYMKNDEQINEKIYRHLSYLYPYEMEK